MAATVRARDAATGAEACLLRRSAPEHLVHPRADRAPLSLHTVELGRLFKRWMVRNHPDKGGDETRASEASALYSRAMGRDAVAGKTPEDMAQEDPALAFAREQQRAEGAWSEWKRARALSSSGRHRRRMCSSGCSKASAGSQRAP